MQPEQLRNIIEAALLVAARPMSLNQLEALFADDETPPSRDDIRESLQELQSHFENRGIELVEVASGWRMQSRQELSSWIAHLFQEKAPRYSRALLETLVLVAYRQPITRGEIEDVRGVAVSSNIIKTLIERDWVKVVGYRDVPGRPELLATTRHFLDYFNLRKIGDLPTLSEIKSLEEIVPELAEEMSMLDGTPAADSEQSGENDAEASESQAENNENSDSIDTDDQAELGSDDAAALAEESEKLSDDDELDASELDSSAVLQTDAIEDGSSVVDVELPPDEDAALEADAEADTKADADSNESKELPSSDEQDDDELLAVNEATIDAMANVSRPDTELLH